MRSRVLVAAALAAAALVAACSTTQSLLEGKKVDYKSAGTLPPLEIPPDLTAPTNDNRYAVPGREHPTTLSGYEAQRTQQVSSDSHEVLPKLVNMHIERDGSQRWLVVSDETPDKLWPLLKEFWQENGFLIKTEQPAIGVMETDWAEDRAKLPRDFARLSLGGILDPLYSTGQRDKFRTRLERTPDGKGTEVYISHRGMVEVYADSEKVRTAWQPRPPDPGLEAEFLRRLMVRLGAKEQIAKQQVAAASAKPMAEIRKDAAGAETLAVFEPFDRAWRRVGLALDRVGFTVEDRNRDKGVYYVRYADPEADAGKEKKSFLSRLAFWRSDEKKVVAEQYRVVVKDAKDDSVVEVLDKNGASANSETSQRILSLLLEQLK